MGYFIFAQGTVDPISGGAGWVGAGLLGLLLGWLLLKHLPDKDKREERKDELHRTHVQSLMVDWKSSLREILAHCDKETLRVTEAMREEFRRLRKEEEDDYERRKRGGTPHE